MKCGLEPLICSISVRTNGQDVNVSVWQTKKIMMSLKYHTKSGCGVNTMVINLPVPDPRDLYD